MVNNDFTHADLVHSDFSQTKKIAQGKDHNCHACVINLNYKFNFMFYKNRSLYNLYKTTFAAAVQAKDDDTAK